MSQSDTAELGFDPDALREKYRAERDKRLRADGADQYIEMSGRFAHYNEDDPYVAPGYTRAPLTDEKDVVIIGGGFSGLLAAARLKEQGVKDVRILEAGGDFGGTWSATSPRRNTPTSPRSSSIRAASAANTASTTSPASRPA